MGKGRFRVVSGGRQWTKPTTYGASKPPKRPWNMMRYMPLWLGAVLVGLWVGIPSDIKRRPVGSEPLALASSGEGIRASFSLCHTGGGYNCVVDGDTIWLQGQTIRIAGIDAPETHDFK